MPQSPACFAHFWCICRKTCEIFVQSANFWDQGTFSYGNDAIPHFFPNGVGPDARTSSGLVDESRCTTPARCVPECWATSPRAPCWSAHLSPSDPRALEPLKEWQPDGAIAHLFNEELADGLAAWGGPVVNITSTLNDPRFPMAMEVKHDAVGVMATEHLLERGFRHFDLQDLIALDLLCPGSKHSTAACKKPAAPSPRATWKTSPCVTPGPGCPGCKKPSAAGFAIFPNPWASSAPWTA